MLGKFRLSLRDLSSTLSSTSARYIRCVKPNSAKAARRFDGQFAARQLRYTGVVDVVQVLRRGYPCVIRKTEFYGRYKALLSSIFGAVAVPPGADDDELCRCVLREAQRLLRDPADDDAADGANGGGGGGEGGWEETRAVQLGRAKVFLREVVIQQLERARHAFYEALAALVQRSVRCALARRRAALARAHRAAAAEARAALGAWTRRR